MSTNNLNVNKIKEILAQATGKRIRGVGLAYKSEDCIFVQFETAEPITMNSNLIAEKWKLVTHWCAWRLEKYDSPLVGSIDVPSCYSVEQGNQSGSDEIVLARREVEKQLQRLHNLTLLGVTVSPISLDTTFVFDEGFALRLFSVVSKNDEFRKRNKLHWFFHLPNGDMLAVGPGDSWAVSNSNKNAE